MALLEDGLKAVGIEEEKIPVLAEKMEKYIAEIALCNSAFNLTNTSDHDELVTRHILDSLAAYVPVRNFLKGRAEGAVNGAASVGDGDASVVNGTETSSDGSGAVTVGDIGSGGGLPGIPLAAAFPQYSFTLVERMSKRCGFLEKTASLLGLSNVTVLEEQAEFVPQKSFDLVTFRAFRPLDLKMTKKLLRLRKDGGILAAYKAKMENIRAEMEGIKKLVPEYKVIQLHVPGLEDSERNLVLV
ncbi:16S rRNA (guanine(527)-N(7))-methyltransferase RsmG [Treponema sp. C6A8]|uniref:16S rRNA (guanine(527)-N(7))-methyltransferase RsmG n=1 Tax=Treponema sp. C6A8 TaxID=1410609 RepID=UPI00048A1156|nr:RsmG family class I SAM-dependent methyltransferase [Treponema sp. C6A8]